MKKIKFQQLPRMRKDQLHRQREFYIQLQSLLQLFNDIQRAAARRSEMSAFQVHNPSHHLRKASGVTQYLMLGWDNSVSLPGHATRTNKWQLRQMELWQFRVKSDLVKEREQWDWNSCLTCQWEHHTYLLRPTTSDYKKKTKIKQV